MDTPTPIHFTDTPVEHETGSYICTRFGLLFEGHKCFNQVGIYLPETSLSYDEEDITISDEITSARSERVVANMPISWWRAQCAFRGLDTTGEIAGLQNRLSISKDVRMLADLTSLEKDLTKEYWAASRAQRKRKDVPGGETGEEGEGRNATDGEGRYEGAEGRTGRRSRGGSRGYSRERRRGGLREGRRGGRIPSRKNNKRGKHAFGEVLKRLGTKPL
ncbi:hypothetical protein L207DRAFT_591249 [Hyaloscypha variabilis F]|uniref:Uncharacterized protein n=1 Tax=Hyaloscypha variabilis (strain UAMH 11265 / GT02V1 / F) TaxID=1149755 RepID=A0A2J6QZY9_HYAVF|nr:hypothetical protein L207DRAFT_591249 [Hyaloscypha variabilis F]